jgi:hypothetical protein
VARAHLIRSPPRISPKHQSEDKAKSVALSRECIELGIPREASSTPYQRVIEFDVQAGNLSSAKSLIRKARYGGWVELAFTDPKCSELLKEVETQLTVEKREEEQRRVEREQRERDEKRSREAANPQNGEKKLAAFRKIVEHVAKLPDPTDGKARHDKWYEQANALLQDFDTIPFSATAHRSAGKKIIELYKEKIDGNYSGQFFFRLQAVIETLAAELTNS